jgi:glycosyltransferase involved in cell wall biosynthesis
MSPKTALPLIAMEISALGEQNHTGIANVTKKLTEALLNDADVDARFFFNRGELRRDLVEKLVQMDSGRILYWITGRTSCPPDWSDVLDRPVAGIYPAHKWHRRLFPCEVKIVHDLTSLIVPQFHSQETIAFEARQVLGDLLSSDLLVAVSESTREDIRTYFPQAAHIPCIAPGLAPCTEPVDPLPGQAAPFVLVLGTLEPRKNVEAVLELLADYPEILDSHVFVFVGRFGWGDATDEVVDRFGLAGKVAQGAIRFLGFVSDDVRNQLLAHARCVVYPSLYEGFGLPVIEALSYGTPVITGYGSSLPEVGGDFAIYCDVTSAEALASALKACLVTAGDVSAQDDEQRSARKRWAASFTWTETYRRIKDATLGLFEEQTEG